MKMKSILKKGFAMMMALVVVLLSKQFAARRRTRRIMGPMRKLR